VTASPSTHTPPAEVDGPALDGAVAVDDVHSLVVGDRRVDVSGQPRTLSPTRGSPLCPGREHDVLVRAGPHGAPVGEGRVAPVHIDGQFWCGFGLERILDGIDVLLCGDDVTADGEM
jgi:hypothetical protein